MAKPLIAASISAPAFYGLNTQASGLSLPEGFALHADNCVIDKQGRLSARKGWTYQTLSVGTVVDANVGIDLLGMADFQEITGDNTRFSWSADTIYKGTVDLTTLTPTTTDTIADGNWQVATLNDHAYFFQRGYLPLVYTNDGGADTFETLAGHAGTTVGSQSANTVLSAYGRLWTADTIANKTTVWFSDVLDGTDWSTGTAGSIDISSVLTQGADEIVALGAHNGFLIIFCKNNIIIYGDNDNFQASMNTTSLTLVEVIEGVGCIARDSKQNTGEDILFLSNTGVRSLNRTVQEKSQPMRNISKNIRDDIMEAIEVEVLAEVKSVYSPHNSVYLLTFPATRQTFVFDTRQSLEDGSFRVTVWPSMTPKAYLAAGLELYYAQPNGIAKYGGYQDNGIQYQMSYYSSFFDLGLPNVNKIVKKMTATTVGATGQDFSLKIGYEYSPIFYSFPFTLESGLIYEYGVAEYDLAEFAGSVLINEQQSSGSGAGNILQVGFTAEINGAGLSLQKLSIFAKQGKVL